DTLQAPGSHEHYVLLLDIDHFKAYNDHYGHMMGDQALIRVSASIRDAIRELILLACKNMIMLLTQEDTVNLSKFISREQLSPTSAY
ncbi:CerR family C-terminal domain-containing protein, partial [Salmonella enterica subsp. enterica serovar Montevideo]|nr:CerR family C-terminal domain-containing protein [Salmonella enterica subsp. enterica serovar Montevideo]